MIADERKHPRGSPSSPPDASPIDPSIDPVVEAYKRSVDRTLLIENLAPSVEDRLLKLQRFLRFLDGVRGSVDRLSPGGVAPGTQPAADSR